MFVASWERTHAGERIQMRDIYTIKRRKLRRQKHVQAHILKYICCCAILHCTTYYRTGGVLVLFPVDGRCKQNKYNRRINTTLQPPPVSIVSKGGNPMHGLNSTYLSMQSCRRRYTHLKLQLRVYSFCYPNRELPLLNMPTFEYEKSLHYTIYLGNPLKRIGIRLLVYLNGKQRRGIALLCLILVRMLSAVYLSF